MKYKTLFAIVFVITLVVLMVGAVLAQTTNATSVAKERQYWQDELIQLSHAWRTRFAHQDSNEVQLAYQSVKVIKAIQAQAGAIGVLRQQVVDLAKGNIMLQGEVAELSKRLKAHTDQPATIDGGGVQSEVDPNGNTD